MISGFVEAGGFWSRRGLWRRIVSGDPEGAVDLPMGISKVKEELPLQKTQVSFIFCVRV